MTVAVGFFDGVHLGHQAILRGADRALTFKNHPLSLLAPERAPKLMMSLDERLAAIRALGVAEVSALDFTPALASLSPETFLKEHILRCPTFNLQPPTCSPTSNIQPSTCTLRCGANWRFGKGGVGDAEWLRRQGVAVEVVPYAELDGEKISSSRIRAALGRGEIASAEAMLARPIVLRGERFAGKGEGRALGFPTVNLRPDTAIAELLPSGVYAAETPDGVRALANLGTAPTFGERAWKERTLEVHFPGLDSAPAQWRDGALKLVRFIRPERRFASVAALRDQLVRDCRF